MGGLEYLEEIADKRTYGEKKFCYSKINKMCQLFPPTGKGKVFTVLN